MSYTTLVKISEWWYWHNLVWKGEVKLTILIADRPQYTTGTFSDVYEKWVDLANDVKRLISEKCTDDERTRLEPWMSMIHSEFDYYRDELNKLAETLNTEQKSRFEKVQFELQRQYGWLYEASVESEQSMLTLLTFLKEMPGRLKIILTTIVAQKTIIPTPDEKRLHISEGADSRFLEGIITFSLEEAGYTPASFH